MTLPSLAKTWVYQKYAVEPLTRTVTLSTADNVTVTTRVWNISGLSLTANDAGRILIISGAVNGANNGQHYIYSVTDSDTLVTSSVTSPATETFTSGTVTATISGLTGTAPACAAGAGNLRTITGLTEMTTSHVGRYLSLGGFGERWVLQVTTDNVVASTKVWTFTNLTSVAADVGRILRITGAANAANNGDHVITARSGNTLTTSGSTLVDETFTTGVVTLTTLITSGLNGYFRIDGYNSATSVDVYAPGAPIPSTSQTGSRWADLGFQQGFPGTSLQAITGAGAGQIRITGLYNMTASSVGRQLCLSGFTTTTTGGTFGLGLNSCSDAHANSTTAGFTITAFVNSTTVDVTNSATPSFPESAGSSGKWSEREASTNQIAGVSSSLAADITALNRKFVENMISQVHLPWQIMISCDGNGSSSGVPLSGLNFTSATDQLQGGDYWNRFDHARKVIYATAGSNHSYVVFINRNMGPQFQVLVDFNSSTNTQARVLVSKFERFGDTVWTPAVAGTGTAAPLHGGLGIVSSVAFNQGVHFGGNNIADAPSGVNPPTVRDFWGPFVAGFTSRFNIMSSLDGKCTRLFVFCGGFPITIAFFELAQNPVTGWNIAPAVPYIAAWGTTTALTQGIGGFTTASVSNTGSWWLNANRWVSRVTAGSTPTTGSNIGFMSSLECVSTSPNIFAFVTNAPMDLTSEWPFQPIGIVHTSATVRNRWGQIFDAWCSSQALVEGDTFPATGTLKQFITVGEWIFPWDQSTPQLS